MNDDLIELLKEQKALLIAVATGGPRIQDKEVEYAARRRQIRTGLADIGANDPIPFSDLWQWYGRWSDGSLPSYQSRRQYIAGLMQPAIDALSAGKYSVEAPVSQHLEEQLRRVAPLDIFISHSAADSALAGSLAGLLRSAFNLAPERIRCTSVDGYRLEVGANTNERLRIEVRETRAFVALLTRNSLISTYVLFEMGARWGAGQHFAPTCAGGLPLNELRSPLSGLNVLDLSSRAQVSQLLDNLAEALGLQMVSRAAFEAHLSELATACSETIFDPIHPQLTVVSAMWGAPGSEIDVTNIVRSQVRNNRVAAFAYGPSLAANDPAFGRPKRLVVNYTVGKEQKTAVIPEGAAESIP